MTISRYSRIPFSSILQDSRCARFKPLSMAVFAATLFCHSIQAEQTEVQQPSFERQSTTTRMHLEVIDVNSTTDFSHYTRGSEFRFDTDSHNRSLFRTFRVAGHIQPASNILRATANSPSNENQPTWFASGNLTPKGMELISMAGRAERDGIDNAALAPAWLQHWQKDLKNNTPQHAEKLLDQLFQSLVAIHGSGSVDPLDAQLEWSRAATETDIPSLKYQIATDRLSVIEAVDLLRPQHKLYTSLQRMLEKLKQQQAAAQIFINPNQTLKKGQSSREVEYLKKALLAMGDLEPGAQINQIFDADLESAVQRFQMRHGLQTDGIASSLTLAALNVPVHDRIEQVKANMERWRWLPAEFEDTYIMVNIPEYKLRMVNNSQQLFDMDVVVGTPEHQTPIFSETMKQVVFAPTWTVPSSITNEELIPRELESPGYLKQEEFEFFSITDRGIRRVKNQKLDRNIFNRKPFPYLLRQKAGENNALGKVKFLMPNKHAVYLHDTQAKDLFNTTRRAYSHGCVRLDNPDFLAYVIMQMDGYDQPTVRDYISKTTTTKVDLKTHIPVHMTYFTAWQDEHGLMHFREDIYKQDGRLIKALQSLARDDEAEPTLMAATTLEP